MARFEGVPLVIGTIGAVCIYKMHGRYFMRSRSSLTSERVKKDAAFRKTMEYATLLARASRIGSAVYAGLPARQKQHALYRKLTGEAMTWLKYGWKETDILEWLQQRYTPQAINLFCRHLKEKRTTTVALDTEEQVVTNFTKRRNRRLLRALRCGDYFMLDDPPPSGRKRLLN
ncbi:MAG: hypothetical protein J7621_27660 [Niastella sp.]|nr:hypothetical protein [Niastella sp.]